MRRFNYAKGCGGRSDPGGPIREVWDEGGWVLLWKEEPLHLDG